LLSTNIFAQSNLSADYFKSKLSVLIKGTPNGDIRLFFLLENSNDSITGVVQDITQTEISKVSKAELTDTSATVYFTAWGYDLGLIMYKKDNDQARQEDF